MRYLEIYYLNFYSIINYSKIFTYKLGLNQYNNTINIRENITASTYIRVRTYWIYSIFDKRVVD